MEKVEAAAVSGEEAEWAALAVSGGAAASEVPKARLGNFPRMPR